MQGNSRGGAAGGGGPALAQAGQQQVAGAGGDGQKRVIAPRTGVAVVAGALLGQSVGLADGGVQVDGQGPWQINIEQLTVTNLVLCAVPEDIPQSLLSQPNGGKHTWDQGQMRPRPQDFPTLRSGG